MANSLDTPEKIEAALLGQEHRVFSVLYNFFVRRHGFEKVDPRRSAIVSALIWRIIAPSTATVGGLAFISIAGVYLAWQANTLFEKQNEKIEAQTVLLSKQAGLVEEQNTLLTQQIQLSEAGRRASLVFELTSILDEIDEEIDELEDERDHWLGLVFGKAARGEASIKGVENAAFELSPRLVGRIQALSHSLKPYQYLDESGKFTTEVRSPERAQLLISLVAAGIKMEPINIGASFANADLDDANLRLADLPRVILPDAHLRDANLRDANLRRANLQHANLRGADLWNAYLLNAHLQHADLRGAKLQFADLRGARLQSADLRGADLSFADLDGADLDGARVSSMDWFAKSNAKNLVPGHVVSRSVNGEHHFVVQRKAVKPDP